MPPRLNQHTYINPNFFSFIINNRTLTTKINNNSPRSLYSKVSSPLTCSATSFITVNHWFWVCHLTLSQVTLFMIKHSENHAKGNKRLMITILRTISDRLKFVATIVTAFLDINALYVIDTGLANN